MTPEEAKDRIADALMDAGVPEHQLLVALKLLMHERQALLVAMGGRRHYHLDGWVVPDE